MTKTPQTRVLFSHTLSRLRMGVFAAFMAIMAVVASVSVIWLTACTPATAATANTMNFQARLLTSAGSIVTDGKYNVEFKLYSASAGGSPLWTETYYDTNGVTAGNDNRVTVRAGYLSVYLGSLNTFPGTINWDQDLYLTMNIGGTTHSATPTYDGEMNPRLKLTAVPYAFKAGQLAQFNSVTGFTSTLSLAQPTVGNQDFVLPDQGAAGTYNLLTEQAANAAYIQNQNSLQQASSQFWISGSGRADSSFLTPVVDTASAATLSLGTTTATAVSIAKTGVATTVNGTLVVTEDATFNGDVVVSGTNTLTVGTGATTLGGTLAVTGTATFADNVTFNGTQLTNNGSTLNVATALTDFATGGAIGSAASTVDSQTSFTINQTTSGQTLSLPNPTDTTAGRIIYVSNVGTTNFTMHATNVAANGNAAFLWNGTAWRATTDSGISVIGTLDSQTKSANGAVVVGSNLYLQTADATYPGLVGTGSQTFAGAKTFTSEIAVTGTGLNTFNGPATFGASGNYGIVTLQMQSQDNFSSGLRVQKRGNGTDINGAVASGGEIGYHEFYAWDGNAYARGAYVVAAATEAWTNTSRGTSYSIATTANGTTTNVARMIVDQNGNVGIGDTTPAALLTVGSGDAFQITSAGNVATSGTLTVANNATFNGNQLTNNGSTLNGVTALTNFATGGSIGSAATTVDVKTAFTINQTTASQTLSLPNPTSTTAGRLIYVSNIGSAAFTMHSIIISAGSNAAFIWNGSTWRALIDSGISAVGTLDSQVKSADGAVVVGSGLYLQTADATNPGLVSTAAQAFAGAKTFNDVATFAAAGTGLSVTNNASIGGTLSVGGSVLFANGSNDATVSAATLTADRNILLPDEDGTLCIRNSANCGFLTGSPANYIQNGTTTQSAANFNIRSAATGSIVAVLEGANGQTADLLALRSYDGTSSTTVARITAAGNLQVAGSIDTVGASALNIGSVNATAISVADTGVSTTVNGALIVAETTTLNGAVSVSGTNTLTVGTGAVTFGGTLGVTGATTLSNTLNVSGATTLTSTLSVAGNTSFTGDQVSNSGSTLNVATALSNFPAGGAIGTAAATVDIKTAFTINQTTSGQTISLPNPTVTTAGRIVYVSNIGTANFTMHGQTVLAGSNASYVWNGSAWKLIVDAGVSVIGVMDSQTKSADGAVISGSNLYLQTADATYAGLVSTGVQTFAGDKTFNGAVTLGAAGTSLSVLNNASISGALSVAGVTNSSFTLNTALALSNFPTGGSIGSAATTVDVKTVFTVNQTTAAQTLTIPNPTTTTAGRSIYITNIGTASFMVGGIRINPANTASFIWNGTAWILDSSLSLQSVYNASTNPELVVDSVNGGLTVRDNASAIGGNLLEVQSNNGGTTYFAVTSGGAAVTGTLSATVSVLTPSIDTAAAGTLNIGVTNATAVSIGQASVPTTVFGALTVSGNTTLSGDQLTNNGSTLNTATALSNFATGGSIGSAATTVDIKTAFTINQTTAAQTLSLPNPTATTAGRIIYVSNIGSTAFTMHTVIIAAGSNASYLWNGTAWRGTVDSGVSAIGSIDSQTKSADGAVIVGSGLFLQTADATNPGLVSTGTQTFAGAKTFSGAVTMSAAGTALTVTNNASVGGNLSAGGTLTVTGATTLSSTLAVTGNTTLSADLSVANNATVGGTLDVTGVTTLADDASVGGDLIVDGNAIVGSSAVSASRLGVTAGGASQIGVAIRAAASQTANLLQLQNSGDEVLASFAANGQLTLGRAGVSGTNVAGAITFADGTNSGYTGTVTNETLTASRRYLLPDTTLATTASPGTICVFNGMYSNCPAASGSEFYIQNTTVVQDDTNFYIRSAAATDVTGVLEGFNGQTADLLNLRSYDGTTSTTVARVTAAGNLQVASSVDTTAAVSFNIGTTNASGVSVSKSGATTAVNGALTVAQSATFNGNQLTNAGATLNTATALSNFATGGSIGSAATTVDIKTAFTINQTTAAQTLSLPTPTNTAAGRVVYISNLGSASFIIDGATVPAGGNAFLLWNGSAWAPTVQAGISSLGTLDGRPKTSDGGAVFAGALYLQTADATNPGLVSTGTQTFAGAKTFSGAATFSAAGTGLSVTNNASIGGNLGVTGNITASGSLSAVGVNSGTGLLQGTGGLTLTGTTAINTTGTANTSIGNGTGTFALQSSGVDIATNGDISTPGGYTQSGTSANTFTGATTFSASGTALTVTNNATVGGTFGVTGAATLSSTLAVTSNTTVGGTLNVTGASTLSSAAITGNATVGGTFDATGATTLGSTLGVTGNATFNGNQMTNNGSNVSSALALGNFATGGSIGSAATTVDIRSGFTVNQTTAAQALTLPNPTATTAGRSIYVSNIGSASFEIGGVVIAPATTITYIWNGTAWTSTGSGAGVSYVGTVDGQAKSANGAVINGNTLYMQTADATNIGLVSTGAQTFAGAKTFNGAVTLAAAGTGLSVTNNATIGGTLAVTGNTTVGGTFDATGVATFGNNVNITGNAAVTGSVTAVGVNSGTGLLQGTGGLTLTGTTAINTTGTANTSIGNATGTFSLASSALNVSTAGALTGVTGITTTGGYTQSGTSANTFTSATTFSASGTALTVTNNASVGGNLSAGGTLSVTGAATLSSTLAVTGNTTVGGTFDATGATTLGSTLGVSGNTTLSGNQFTNNGSTLNGVTALSNFATGGSIGTAAATVNVKTSFTINQTTAAQTLSLPTPTNTAAGRIVYVSNIGSASFTMHGAIVPTGATTMFVWNGSAWTAAADNGATTIGTIDSQTKSADGAVISGTSLYLQTADATNPGLVSTSTQTFAGAKTFNGAVTLAAAGTGLSVTNNATIGGTLGVTGVATFSTNVNIGGNAAVTGSVTAVGVNSGTGLLQGTGGLTLTGTTAINTTGTANTSIGNAIGTFSIQSSGFNVTTGGALSGVTGITTTGGYTQSGTSANTFTGATTFSASGTALTVTNNATIGGTLAVTGNTTVGGTFDATGATTLGSTLAVTGATSLNGNVTLGDSVANDTLTFNSTIQGNTPFVFEGTTADGNETTFAITDPTADNTVTFGNESGTVCLQNSINCGFAAASGSANYIQNQNSTQQASSNFWISGTGRADGGFVATSLDAASAVALSLGVTNASGVNISKSGATTAVNGALTVAQTTTFNGNVSVSGANTLTVGTGATTLGGTLGVTGAATLSSTLGVTGATTLSSTLGVTGATTLSSTLAVSGNTTLSGDQLTNNGSTLNTATALSNFATGGSIGTAAATVNVKTSFTINQTTAAQTLSLPNPTVTTAGRMVYVSNNGSVAFTMHGAMVATASTVAFMWNGSAWTAAADNGVTTIGTIDSQTKSADGAVISGSTLYLQTADATYSGVVSTGTQTFAGAKTFNGVVTANGAGNGLVVTNSATIGVNLTVSNGATQLTGASAGSGTALTVNTGATTNKGMVIQGATSQSANLLEVAVTGVTDPVLAIGATGVVNYRNTTNSTQAFNIDNSTGGNVFTVDTTNSRVGINLGANNTPTSTLEVNGTLRLSGTATESFVTPGSASVPTKINIPVFDPGAFGQVLALGVSNSAQSTARVISIFDGRTTPHQVSLGVFSPDENSMVGFNWNGSNTTAMVQTIDGATGSRNLIMQSGNLTAANNSNSGDVQINSGSLDAGTGGSSGTIYVVTGSASSTNGSSGNVVVDSGSRNGSGTTGTISLGVTNASGVSISRSGVTTTVNGALTVAQTATLSSNATVGGTLGVTGATTLSSTLGVTGATTLSSTLGVSGNTTLSGNQLTNNGSTLNTVSALTDFASGGSIGSAATTVDVKTAFTINQTTASQTLSLPNPTSTTAGRLIYVSNIGSAAFTMHGAVVAATSTATFMWNGSAWTAAADTGVTVIGTIDSQTKSANGAVISGSTLYMQTADGSNPGLVSATTQTFGGAKTFNGAVTLASAGTGLSVTNNATVGGTLGVTGAVTLSSTLAVTGNSTLTGTLGVTGATTLSTLSVTSNATVGGTFDATGATTLGSTLSVAGTTSLNGTLVTNAGATLNTATALSNFATGGSIGSAATTVDVKTNFTINQTTAAQTLSLPNPTATTAGRIVYVSNIGSESFTLHGQIISAGATANFVWNGSAWSSMADSGVTAIGALDGQTKSANGAVISGSSLYLQTADATNPGLVSTGTQTFAGAKTFSAAGTALSVTNNATIGGTLTVGGITTTGGYTQSGSTANTFTGVTTISAANGLVLGASSTSTGGIVFRGSGGTGTLTVVGPTTPDAGNYTLSIPAITANQSICVSGTVCTGYQAAPASGSFLMQVPTSSAENTVTPTASSVIGLTVNGTSGGTSALAMLVSQSQTSDTLNVRATNATGTQTNTLTVNRNGAGSTTNLLNLANSAGTVTNAINITGTYTNLINAPNFAVTNAGSVTAVGVNSGTGLLQGTGGLTLTGTTAINTTGTANTSIGNATGTFSLASSALNVSTAGALTGVTGITTTGGYTQSGSTANTFTGASTFNTLTATTINNLTVAAAADGFTIAGGSSTPRTLTVTGANITIGSTITPTSAGSLSVTSNGASAMSVDAGGAAGLELGLANANGVSISRTGINTAINGTLGVAQAATFTGNISQTGATTFSTGSGSVSLNGATTVTSGAFSVTSGNTSLGADLSVTGATSLNGTQVTNAGATLNSGVIINDLPTGGSIGSAATTVDVKTTFIVEQTTASQTLTLPSPTTTTPGRIIYINNRGSTSFIISGSVINVGATFAYMWNGTVWTYTGASAGVTAVGTINSQTPSVNGAVIVGTTIYFQSADASNAGMVSTSAQTFAGAKTFNGQIIGSAGINMTGTSASITTDNATLAANTGALTLTSATAATWSTTAGTLTIQAGGGTVSLGNSTTLSSGAALGINAGAALSLSSGGNTAVNIDNGATGGSANINIGNTYANAISIGRNNITTTVQGHLTVINNTTLGTIGSSVFTNQGATLNTRNLLANFPGGGSIGSAATTVDVYTSFVIPQTTAGQTISLPSPTVTTAGRMIYVANSGSASFTLLSQVIGAGATQSYMWNGTVWTAIGVDTGVTAVGAIDGGTLNANGASISGNTIYLQTASGTNVGLVNTGAQSFAGVKTFNNGLTVGSGAGSGAFTNNGTTLNTVLVLGNFASNQSIGSAATTVDVYTAITIPQTTAGITLSLPTPTSATAGRMVYISNTGSTSFTLLSSTMNAGTTATLFWNGSAWTFAGADGNAILNQNTADQSANFRIAGTGQIKSSSTTAFQVQNALGANVLTVDASTPNNLAINSGGETSITGNWTAHGTATVTQTTTAGEFASGAAGVRAAITAQANAGARNVLGAALAQSTVYSVSFSVRSSTAWASSDVAVEYYRNNTPTLDATCNQLSPAASISTTFIKYTCTFTTSATAGNSTAYLTIRQTASATRNIFIDNLSITAQNTTGALNSSFLTVGGDVSQGLTLLTLDRSAGAPQTPVTSTINPSMFGSMYFDTVLGRIQCYESNGWGSCGNAPDVSVNLIPEYTGAVLNGTGVGTMTADLCSGTSRLSINTSLCGAAEEFNFYDWTSPQATNQTYSIYLRYQLPATFDNFSASDTIKLTARTTDTADASVAYSMYGPTGLQCGSATTVTSSNNTWQTVALTGDETVLANCDFAANDIVLFKIDVTARNNDTAFVSNLTFLTKGK